MSNEWKWYRICEEKFICEDVIFKLWNLIFIRNLLYVIEYFNGYMKLLELFWSNLLLIVIFYKISEELSFIFEDF